MPYYSKLTDANPAILGIKPPVTLEQANAIATAADAITAKGGADNPWAVAIAAFKKNNEVKNGAWVKKGGGAEAGEPDPAATATDTTSEPDPAAEPAAKDEKPADKGTAGKATVKATPESLRVEMMPIAKFDPVTLEHVDVDPSQGISAVIGLPVKWKDGDPKLVQTYVFTGDAWADASAAKWIKKKGAKKGKDWQSGGADEPGAGPEPEADAGGDGTGDGEPMPSEAQSDGHHRNGGKHEHTLAEIRLLVKKTTQLLEEVRGVKPITGKLAAVRECEGEGGHDDGDEFEMPAPLAGVTSYADLENRQAADTAQEELKKIVYFFPQLASEILRRMADEKGKPLDAKGKLKMLNDLAAEFVKLAGEALDNAPEMDMGPEASGAPAETAVPETGGERLAESFAVSLVDAEPGVTLAEAGPAGQPLRMLVELIQPGWGNTTDNHYYPAEMLKTCAEKFVGRKMFETDHRPEEKSTRTWVSTIEKIRGFSDRGAPLAEVVVHDPGFAERVRNLRTAGMLDKMECSILADGRATGGFEEGGRTGKRVDEITTVESVDWVTRAGAGGHAAELAESGQRGVSEMGEKLTAAAKQKLVEASRLPAVARARLAERDYKDEAELTAALEAERTYLAKVTGAGQVFGNAPAGKVQPLSEADSNKAKDAVLKKYFGR